MIQCFSLTTNQPTVLFSLAFQRSEVCYNLEVMDLQVREMTKEQAADLMAPLEGSYRHNSRPLQQLNGRTVELYDKSLKIRKMV